MLVRDSVLHELVWNLQSKRPLQLLIFQREATSVDLFSTQVDEETLEAAKIRQRRRTIILEPEAAPVTPIMPTMSEVVDGRARQQ